MVSLVFFVLGFAVGVLVMLFLDIREYQRWIKRLEEENTYTLPRE